MKTQTLTPLTYVYCLLQNPRRPAPGRTPAGLPGAGPVRVLEGGDALWAVVADVPADRYSEAAIERGLKDMKWVSDCAVAHQAVIEHFGKARAVIPMKLFTLFRGDERALAHVGAQRRRLLKLAGRVSGQRELGVRILFDEAQAARMAEQAASRDARGKGLSGAGFLARKQKLRDAGAIAAAEARERADQVYAALSELSSDATRRTPGVGDPTAGRMVLDAAFLVPSGRVAAFRAAVKRVVKPLPDCDEVTLSGPWPPYSFVAEVA